MSRFSVGSLVRCREREWVVLPSLDEELLLLRPLGGAEAEICGIYLPLEGDAVAPASFAPPDPTRAGDFEAGKLLRDAARLSLRSGAGPFRSLGRIVVRPRPYQLVPLIMALRQQVVRLLIADDVGIGKTIEAALIVRELFDRGEITRLAVLCPPHLCDQWQRELYHKFALDAVVVRSSTAAALERGLPRSGDASLWEHYPFTVASIDYVKSERRRDTFLRTCPELVIVDEAHAAVSAGVGQAQQQRYELVRDLAASRERHLLLLTATPHSGVEDAFKRLIGLLDPAFGELDPDHLHEAAREALARHFVQRRRADVQRWLGSSDVTPFPEREQSEVTYSLPRASPYRRLFDEVHAFTRELVRDSALESPQRSWRQRARYWAALALLRCVMSSPAAAEKALRMRAVNLADVEPSDDPAGSDALFRGYVYDPTDQEGAQDQEPGAVVDQGSLTSERARLNRFAARAAELRSTADPKLQRLIGVVRELLDDGFHPIIYCRYVATADYVAEQLGVRFQQPQLRVLAVTGERSEEEREQLIAELEQHPRRILVATDCLSEGINLQEGFDAVVHYDLPWNPNRLEQREGRVDRYGQRRERVRTVLLYGQDNPMDEAVMRVLLRKAVTIHRTLGISVPLPIDSGRVVESLIESLFTPSVEQLELFDAAHLDQAESHVTVRELDQAWDRAVAREKESRTRFAQRRIKPEEVARELEESDAVLGDTATVERFVLAACARLGAPVSRRQVSMPDGREEALMLALQQLPRPLLERLHGFGSDGPGRLLHHDSWRDGDVLYLLPRALQRNHPLVAALADYLLETALTPSDEPAAAARCGVIRTQAVQRRTRLLLLRVRMLVESPRQRTAVLAEELVVAGYQGRPSAPEWLAEAEALRLLDQAVPTANLEPDERLLALQREISELGELNEALARLAEARAARLLESHRRVRAQIGGGQVSVRPASLPDVLGVYVLLPR